MTRQQEINSLISTFGVKKSFLARKLGVSRQVLSYQLNVADELDHDYYVEILAILESMRKGLQPEDNESGSTFYVAEESQNLVREPQRFKIEASIPAGPVGELIAYDDWYETDVLDYNPNDHVFLRVDEEFGHSMMPLVAPGDLVLISFSAKPKNGDMVAARWDQTKGALKIYQEHPLDPLMLYLLSYNQSIPMIPVPRKTTTVYKVMLLKKQR